MKECLFKTAKTSKEFRYLFLFASFFLLMLTIVSAASDYIEGVALTSPFSGMFLCLFCTTFCAREDSTPQVHPAPLQEQKLEIRITPPSDTPAAILAPSISLLTPHSNNSLPIITQFSDYKYKTNVTTEPAALATTFKKSP